MVVTNDIGKQHTPPKRAIKKQRWEKEERESEQKRCESSSSSSTAAQAQVDRLKKIDAYAESRHEGNELTEIGKDERACVRECVRVCEEKEVWML